MVMQVGCSLHRGGCDIVPPQTSACHPTHMLVWSQQACMGAMLCSGDGCRHPCRCSTVHDDLTGSEGYIGGQGDSLGDVSRPGQRDGLQEKW